MDYDSDDELRDLLAFALNVRRPGRARQKTIERVMQEIGDANFLATEDAAAETAERPAFPDITDDLPSSVPGDSLSDADESSD